MCHIKIIAVWISYFYKTKWEAVCRIIFNISGTSEKLPSESTNKNYRHNLIETQYPMCLIRLQNDLHILLLLLLLFSFTVSSTEGLAATCAVAFELS